MNNFGGSDGMRQELPRKAGVSLGGRTALARPAACAVSSAQAA